MNVQIEGKNVQFLSDQMLNNCGPSGNPPNSATMAGVIHVPLMPLATPKELLQEIACRCDKKRANNYKDGERLSCARGDHAEVEDLPGIRIASFLDEEEARQCECEEEYRDQGKE